MMNKVIRNTLNIAPSCALFIGTYNLDTNNYFCTPDISKELNMDSVIIGDKGKRPKRSKLPQLISLSKKRESKIPQPLNEQQNFEYKTNDDVQRVQTNDGNSRSLKRRSIPIRKCSTLQSPELAIEMDAKVNIKLTDKMNVKISPVSPVKSPMPVVNKRSRIPRISKIQEKLKSSMNEQQNLFSTVRDATTSHPKTNESKIPRKSDKMCLLPQNTSHNNENRRMHSPQKISKNLKLYDKENHLSDPLSVMIEENEIRTTKNSVNPIPHCDSTKENSPNVLHETKAKTKGEKRISKLPRLTSLRKGAMSLSSLHKIDRSRFPKDLAHNVEIQELTAPLEVENDEFGTVNVVHQTVNSTTLNIHNADTILKEVNCSPLTENYFESNKQGNYPNLIHLLSKSNSQNVDEAEFEEKETNPSKMILTSLTKFIEGDECRSCCGGNSDEENLSRNDVIEKESTVITLNSCPECTDLSNDTRDLTINKIQLESNDEIIVSLKDDDDGENGYSDLSPTIPETRMHTDYGVNSNTDSAMEEEVEDFEMQTKSMSSLQIEDDFVNPQIFQNTQEDTFSQFTESMSIQSVTTDPSCHGVLSSEENVIENKLKSDDVTPKECDIVTKSLIDLKNIEVSLREALINLEAVEIPLNRINSIVLNTISDDNLSHNDSIHTEFDDTQINTLDSKENTEISSLTSLSTSTCCLTTSNENNDVKTCASSSLSLPRSKIPQIVSSKSSPLIEEISEKTMKITKSAQLTTNSEDLLKKDFDDFSLISELTCTKEDENIFQSNFQSNFEVKSNEDILGIIDVALPSDYYDFTTSLQKNMVASESCEEKNNDVKIEQTDHKRKFTVLASSNYAQVLLPCDSSKSSMDKQNSDYKSLTTIPHFQSCQNVSCQHVAEQLVATDESILMYYTGSHFKGQLRMKNISSSSICYRVTSCISGRYIIIPHYGLIKAHQQVSVTVAAARSSRGMKMEMNQFKIEAAIVVNTNEVITPFGQQLFWKEVHQSQIQDSFVGRILVVNPYQSKIKLDKNNIRLEEASAHFQNITKNINNLNQGHYDLVFYSTLLLSVVVTFSFVFQVPIIV